MIILFKLIKFLKPYKKECILGPMFKLLEAILELLLPTLMAFIINKGIRTHNTSYVFHLGAVMVILSILGFFSSMTCQYFAAKASQGFGTNLRNTIFEHISSFSYVEIDKFGTSSLVNRITNDINQLQLAVAMFIRLVVRAPFICIGSIIMAMLLDFKLSLILIAFTPVFAIILYFVLNKTSPLYSAYQRKLDKLGLVLEENLSGVRVIRSFAKTRTEQARFNSSNDDLTATAVHVGKISALLNPLTSLIMNMAIITILLVGGLRINSGSLSQGSIIAFINYVTQILLALIVVSNLVIIFTKAFASAKRVNEILETSSSITDSTNTIDNKSNISPAIRFENVSFGYSDTGDTVLENISLSINHGQTIGIIGSTGSGKSTFVNLMARFYDATRGEIFVNGINIKAYPLKNLRNIISVVPQKALLFTGTIAENIRWGKKDATMEEIKRACNIAQADEFISTLPKGYNTEVVRGGLNFSGGQKQRLTIARAVVSKSQILILDDSTSALDFITDSAVRGAIKQSSEDITLIIVSQRASTVKYADKIIVFDDGRIAGQGHHDELIDTCNVYNEICLSQLSNEGV